MRRHFLEYDPDADKIDAYTEEDGVRIAAPDFDRPLTRLTEAEKLRRGMDRLIRDIQEADDDPLMP